MEYLDNFLIELDYHSKSMLGCPFNIADSILYDECMIRTFRLFVFNRVLSDALKSVGLKLRFTHLDRNERQKIFTEETCEQVFDHIYTQKGYGVLSDRIALEILMDNMLGKLDCEIYLRDVLILNQLSKRREASTGDSLPVLMRQTLKNESRDPSGQSHTVMEKEFTFTVELFGIKADGGNDIVFVGADSLTEAEIIIESFHESYDIIECICNVTGNLVDWL